MDSTSFSQPSAIAEVMRLNRTGESAFTARNLTLVDAHETPRTVVFGGQLLGQIIVAATEQVPGKRVATVQVVFCRPATTASDLDIEAEVLQDGRSIATVTVTVSQHGIVSSRALVTLDAGDDDLIRHGDGQAPVAGPENAVAVDWAEEGSEVRMVGAVDFVTLAENGPAEAEAWVRFPGTPTDATIDRALLAWYTDMFMMGATMRPHDGVGFAAAHSGISTGVIGHSLIFHREWKAADWFLIGQQSTYAGAGRYYGTGTVRSETGDLLASFSQYGMVRAMAERPGSDPKSVM